MRKRDRLKAGCRRVARKAGLILPKNGEEEESPILIHEYTKGQVRPNRHASPNRSDYLRKRILVHRQEYYRYHLWKEGVQLGLSKGEMARLLGEKAEVIAAPVLYLHRDDLSADWRREELLNAVDMVLATLNMDRSFSFSDPTDRAGESCRIWAATEAKKKLDSFRR